jgi:hypothetical protein
MFEIRVLRRIFRLKRDKVGRGWIVLYNEELHDLFSLPSKIRILRLEVFTTVTMLNGIFWDVTPCGSCKNLRFGGT